MATLQQIVVQISNVDSERSILQYGEGFLPEEQRFIDYKSLSAEDQTVWDDFIKMLVSQRVPDSGVKDRI
jgi:hypothetical protein